MAMKSSKPPWQKENPAGHVKQPHGKSTGEPNIDKPHNNQSYAAEQREHWGKQPEGKTMGSGKEVANVGPADRGSELIEDCGMGHEKQSHGKGIGTGSLTVAEHHKSSSFGGVAHSFRLPDANRADGYGHSTMQRKGSLRVSGVKGAHRVGHRGK